MSGSAEKLVAAKSKVYIDDREYPTLAFEQRVRNEALDEAAGIVLRHEAEQPQIQPFQQRIQPWMLACFGEVISADRIERNHRFLEEALELVQACGCTREECLQLVDYVFGRPVGVPSQEVGGVMVTLAALCLANTLDMHDAAEVELTRIWGKIEQIRAKQAAKPRGSVLPIAPSYAPAEAEQSQP